MGEEETEEDKIMMREGGKEEVVMRGAGEVEEGLDGEEVEVEVTEGARGGGIRKR